jgi:hypothetical protein
MHPSIHIYNLEQEEKDMAICDCLANTIDAVLPEAESKIWHRHPVWFIDGNPILGYSKQKKGLRLMFWSGADFDEPILIIGNGKFKDASLFYNDIDEIVIDDLTRCLKKSREIQWDYKNIVKKKGKLEKINFNPAP